MAKRTKRKGNTIVLLDGTIMSLYTTKNETNGPRHIMQVTKQEERNRFFYSLSTVILAGSQIPWIFIAIIFGWTSIFESSSIIAVDALIGQTIPDNTARRGVKNQFSFF
jgi:hypothetical protein